MVEGPDPSDLELVDLGHGEGLLSVVVRCMNMVTGAAERVAVVAVFCTNLC